MRSSRFCVIQHIIHALTCDIVVAPHHGITAHFPVSFPQSLPPCTSLVAESITSSSMPRALFAGESLRALATRLSKLLAKSPVVASQHTAKVSTSTQSPEVTYPSQYRQARDATRRPLLPGHISTSNIQSCRLMAHVLISGHSV